MEQIKNDKGPHAGKIAVRQMLRHLGPGECYSFNPGDVDAEYAAVACSKESRESGIRYSVSASKELEGRVVICRPAESSENNK